MKRDREAEQLRDLGHVLVGADPIGRDVLEHRAGMGRRLQRAARARHPGERVDDDGVGLDRVLQRREREQGRGRVAPGVRDQAPRVGDELGQPVDPVAEPVRDAGA